METQLCETGKLNSMPNAAHAPRYPMFAFFDGWIRVEHRLAAELVDASVEMPADIRQYGALQVFVLQVDGPPVVRRATIGQVLAQRVRIVEAGGGELVERRIAVGQPFFVGWQGEGAFPNPDLGVSHWQARHKQEGNTGDAHATTRFYRHSAARRPEFAPRDCMVQDPAPSTAHALAVCA